MALVAVAIFFPAESFAGASGSIASDCAFLLETPDDSSTLSATFDIDVNEVLALAGDGVKFVAYFISSDFPCFNKAANSKQLFSADNFFTAGISRSKYSIKRE